MKLFGGLNLFSVAVIGIGLSASCIAGDQSPAAGAAPGAEPPNTPASIAAGDQTYHQYCAACHGPQAQGGSTDEGVPVAPPNLTAPHLIHAPNDLAMFNTIKHGIPPNYYMIPWDGTLSDAQIWNVIHYIGTLRSKK
jgi:mono/diheme cytochrome c family protein